MNYQNKLWKLKTVIIEDIKFYVNKRLFEWINDNKIYIYNTFYLQKCITIKLTKSFT